MFGYGIESQLQNNATFDVMVDLSIISHCEIKRVTNHESVFKMIWHCDTKKLKESNSVT